MGSLGRMLAEGKGIKVADLKQAITWASKSAKLGNSASQVNLGQTYLHGVGGLVQNYQQAASWLRKGAEQGNRDALQHLTKLQKSGKGPKWLTERAIEKVVR